MRNPIGAVSCHIAGRSPEEIVECARRHGLDAIEWFESGDRVWATPENAARIRTLQTEHGFESTFHAPYVGRWSLASGDADVSRRILADILDRADRLGARLITVHLGTLPGERDRQDVLEEIRDVVLQAVPLLRASCMRLAFENFTTCHSPADIGDRLDDLETVLSDLPPDIAGWTLDTGHAAITRNLDALLNALGSRLINTHLHDSDGVEDGHLPPGRGVLDWQHILGRLKQIKYNGCLTLEFPERSGQWPTFIAYLRSF